MKRIDELSATYADKKHPKDFELFKESRQSYIDGYKQAVKLFSQIVEVELYSRLYDKQKDNYSLREILEDLTVSLEQTKRKLNHR